MDAVFERISNRMHIDQGLIDAIDKEIPRLLSDLIKRSSSQELTYLELRRFIILFEVCHKSVFWTHEGNFQHVCVKTIFQQFCESSI